MKFLRNILLFALPVVLSACIGDDIINDTVAERLRVINAIDTLALGDSYQFEVQFLNNVGREEENPAVVWESSAPEIVSIDPDGLARGVKAGEASIIATVSASLGDVKDTVMLAVGDTTTSSAPDFRVGTLKTTSTYTLRGGFTLRQGENGLVLELGDDFEASSTLPGLYVYLTNNPATSNGAFEIGETKTFSGAHSYELPPEIELSTFNYVLYYCKPFNVKVGDGPFDE